MRIHHTTWHFDGATKVEIVVTLVEGELFKLLLGDLRSIPAYIVIDGSSSGNGCLVWHHVEIEYFISTDLDKRLIDDGTGARILDGSVFFMEESSINEFVENTENDFRAVSAENLF